MPAAAHSPWPSEPLATRTHGTSGVGWPSSGLVISRRVSRSWSIAPASLSAAHRSGAAWPLESTKTSAPRPLGSFGSKRISSKKRTETMSAADMHVVGCPEPARVVDSSEWRRSFWAMRKRAESSAMGAGSPFCSGRGEGREYSGPAGMVKPSGCTIAGRSIHMLVPRVLLLGAMVASPASSPRRPSR